MSKRRMFLVTRARVNVAFEAPPGFGEFAHFVQDTKPGQLLVAWYGEHEVEPAEPLRSRLEEGYRAAKSGTLDSKMPKHPILVVDVASYEDYVRHFSGEAHVKGRINLLDKDGKPLIRLAANNTFPYGAVELEEDKKP